MRLAEGDAAADQLRRPGDDEERLAILLELRALMRLSGVLDRQLMQPEFLLHAPEQLRGGLVEADPDHMPGTRRPFAGVLDARVADAPAAGVDARRDHARFVFRIGRGGRFGDRLRAFDGHDRASSGPAIGRAPHRIAKCPRGPRGPAGRDS